MKSPFVSVRSASVFSARFLAVAFLIFVSGPYEAAGQQTQPDSAAIRFQANTHPVVLDSQSKIISWMSPQETAYDRFLHQRWNFIQQHVPLSPGPAPRSLYPQYYFYCAYRPKDGTLEPDQWMNDLGEKIPNWVESARLYYAYTGDTTVMTIVKDLALYGLEHGISPAHFAWPNFPYTCTNAGDTVFRGFTSAKRFVQHEIQVDHASEMGLAYFRLYQFYGDKKFRDAAINVANTLASKVRKGSATHSPWPYLVIMDSGVATCEYGANWTGAYTLLDDLVRANLGDVAAYRKACSLVKEFLMTYPLQTGFWTDGHSDTKITSNTYKSNLSASNFRLFMFDFPDFNKNWKSDIPQLMQWTEKYFIDRGAPGEPGNMWGASIVGEQDDFLYKMDYQTARYGAECARWYAVTGDESFREKAYRALNWVTYCNDSIGMAYESPLSKNISNWWSDCYGEGPRMFYHAFAGIPEFAPPGENHILYGESIMTDVLYRTNAVGYTPADPSGIEFLRLAFEPAAVTIGAKRLQLRKDTTREGYTLRSLGNGDYAVIIKRMSPGKILVAGR